MTRPALLVAALLLVPAVAGAQTDMFVVLIGDDTLAVERMVRTPSRLEGELVDKLQKLRWSYAATLTASGQVTKFENAIRQASADPAGPALQSATMVFAGDSVFVDISGAGGERSQRLVTREGGRAFPYINPSFALYELMIANALGTAGDGDSTSAWMWLVTGGQTLEVAIRRIPGDSITATVANSASRLAWREGRFEGGIVPAQNVRLIRTVGNEALLHVPRPDYSAPVGAPYTAEAVSVPTPMGHILAGTLTLPRDRSGPVPAVVTISGSGAQDRDEEIPIVRGYRPFRQIADSLGHQGIAVLRMDDRGFGESGGPLAGATTSDFADDIRAGVAYLRTRPEIDPARVVLLGHSEGGIVGPMIAADDPDLAGVVIMAGPSRTGREIIVYQNRYAIEHAPQIRPEARDSALAAARVTLDSMVAASAWLRFFMDYDPLPTARRIRIPTLILHGATDRQVTVNQAEELGAAIRAAGNPDVTVRTFAEANHLFVQDPDGNPAGYPGLRGARLRDDVMRTLVDRLEKERTP